MKGIKSLQMHMTGTTLSPEERLLFRRHMRLVRCYNKPEKSESSSILPQVVPAEKASCMPLFERPSAPLVSTADYWSSLPQRQRQRLRRGKYRIADTLDLHQCSREQAAVMLSAWLPQGQPAGCCWLLIHGRGRHSGESGAVLRPFVQHWLRQHAAVCAFCPAQPRDGGSGALYLLLRRMPQQLSSQDGRTQ